MKLTITVHGDAPNISEEKIAKNGERFLERLGDIAIETANNCYASVDYVTKDGRPRDYFVEKNMISSNACEVIASGEDVLFMEYGSGVEAIKDENGNYGSGSWSSSENGTGEFSKYGSWHVRVAQGKKVKIESQPPAQAMNEASKEIMKQANQIAKEEFTW